MDFKYVMNNSKYSCSMKIESDKLTYEQCVVIEQWLKDDVISPEDVIIEFCNALNSKEEFTPKCLGGNGFWREIGKEYTLITFQYEDCYSEGKCPFKPCKVSTELLYEIVKVWAVEYKKWGEECAEFMKKNPDYKPKILGSFKDLFPWKK